MRDIIDCYHQFALPRVWGDGKSAAADGTQYHLYEQNLVADYHIRYGSFGAIAYHHVSDNYIALFSHFIPPGVWEAIYIIEGLLKNTSVIQPDRIHADTQGQSTPVFAFSYLLGIQLMPRIRNWKDLTFYRSDKSTSYQHIDSLFNETVDWKLIEDLWQDLMQVAISIERGHVSSAVLLRKLGHYSRKNRLYQVAREVGRVIRTIFLLDYISDLPLRRQITATTNKAEAYNGFAKWLFFGGEGVITENDRDEQEKRIKYNDLVANAAILQNVIDIERILRELAGEGRPVSQEDLAYLSPYLTRSHQGSVITQSTSGARRLLWMKKSSSPFARDQPAQLRLFYRSFEGQVLDVPPPPYVLFCPYPRHNPYYGTTVLSSELPHCTV